MQSKSTLSLPRKTSSHESLTLLLYDSQSKSRPFPFCHPLPITISWLADRRVSLCPKVQHSSTSRGRDSEACKGVHLRPRLTHTFCQNYSLQKYSFVSIIIGPVWWAWNAIEEGQFLGQSDFVVVVIIVIVVADDYSVEGDTEREKRRRRSSPWRMNGRDDFFPSLGTLEIDCWLLVLVQYRFQLQPSSQGR